MQLKVYIVTEINESGGEVMLAARLSNEAARSIAKQKGNRRVTRLIATKEMQLTAKDEMVNSTKEQNHDKSTKCGGDHDLHL